MFTITYDQPTNTIRLEGGSESNRATPADIRVALSSIGGAAATRMTLTRSRVVSFAHLVVAGFLESSNYNWSFLNSTYMRFEGAGCNFRADGMTISINAPNIGASEPLVLVDSTSGDTPGTPTLSWTNCAMIIDDSNDATYLLQDLSQNSFIKNFTFQNSLVDSPTNAARSSLEFSSDNSFIGNIITRNVPLRFDVDATAVNFAVFGTSNRNNAGVQGIDQHAELIFPEPALLHQLNSVTIPMNSPTSRINFGFIGDTQEVTVNIANALFDYSRVDINGENVIRCSRILEVNSTRSFDSDLLKMFLVMNPETNVITGAQQSSTDASQFQIMMPDVWVGTGAQLSSAAPRGDYTNPTTARAPASIVQNYEHELIARSFDSLYVNLPFHINDDALDLTGQQPESVPLQVQFSRDPAISVTESAAGVLASNLIYTTDQIEITGAMSLNEFYTADKWHKTRPDNLILQPVVDYTLGQVAGESSTFFITSQDTAILISGTLSGRGLALDVGGSLSFGTFGRTSAFYRYTDADMNQVVTWAVDPGVRDFAIRITNTTTGAVELGNLVVLHETLLDGILIREIISGENHSAFICPSDGMISRVAINSDAAPLFLSFEGFDVFSPLAGYSVTDLRTMTGSTNGATFTPSTNNFTINNAGQIDFTILAAWIQLGILNNLEHFNTHPMTFTRPTITFTGISITLLGTTALVDPVGFINFVPGADGVFRNPVFGNPNVTHDFNLQFSGTTFTAVVYEPAPGQPAITDLNYLIVNANTGVPTTEDPVAVTNGSISLALTNVVDDLLVYSQVPGYTTHLRRLSPATSGSQATVDDLQLLPPTFNRGLNVTSFLDNITVAIVDSVIRVTFGSTTDIDYTPEQFTAIMYAIERMTDVFEFLVLNDLYTLFTYTPDGGITFQAANILLLVPDNSSVSISTTAPITYSGSVPINSPVLNPFNTQTDSSVPPVRFEILPTGSGPSFDAAFDQSISRNRVLTIEGFERLNQG